MAICSLETCQFALNASEKPSLSTKRSLLAENNFKIIRENICFCNFNCMT